MRRFIIDTDTASDDAVAIIMALREPSIRVEAITVVAGNVPVDLGVKNARISVEIADSYTPPVYKGAFKPILKELFTSEYIHGDDGMGNMDLQEPSLLPADGHAIDAIIDIVTKNPHGIEIITLGPLTNLALAYLKEPDIAKKVKNVVVMGGAGLGPGNITPSAEFNIFVDAEAASVVLESGMPLTLVGWDVAMGKTFIDQDNLDYLASQRSSIADFCVRCNKVLQEFNFERVGRVGFDLPDPAAAAAAIWPETITSKFQAYAYVETKSERTYGQLVIDQMNTLKKAPNVTVCKEMNAELFKELLFKNIT